MAVSISRAAGSSGHPEPHGGHAGFGEGSRAGLPGSGRIGSSAMVASAIDPPLQIREDLFAVEELTTACLLQAHGDGGTEGIFGGFLLLEKAQSFSDDFSFRGVPARRHPRSNEIFEIGGECDPSRSLACHIFKIHPALPTPQRPGTAGLVLGLLGSSVEALGCDPLELRLELLGAKTRRSPRSSSRAAHGSTGGACAVCSKPPPKPPPPRPGRAHRLPPRAGRRERPLASRRPPDPPPPRPPPT